MLLKTTKVRDLSILDFDIEARPLSYIGGDYTSREITAIAWSWDTPGNSAIHCVLLGDHSSIDMLEFFRVMYDQADIVTGHYIRKYDLPNLNGAMLENGLPPLSPKLVSDTKEDLVKIDGVSKSQESLAGMLGLGIDKYHMTQADWREANRLTEDGIKLTSERVKQDVRQHKAMRAELVRLGMLGAPRMWYPHAE